MKATLRFIGVLASLVALAFLNPGPEEFREYVSERVQEQVSEETGDSGLGGVLSRLGSDLAGSLASSVADRTNFGLFSVYGVDVDGDDQQEWRFIGIAGQFFELNAPE